MAEEGRRRGALAGILLLGFGLNVALIDWGLPNGNETWATDALSPLSPLAVAYESFRRGWNSGWFFFKYPLGHLLLLLVCDLPYLGFLWLTGDFRNPSPDWPYGFTDPQSALMGLALIARGVTVLMGTGNIWLVYDITRRLFGVGAGLWAAIGVAGGAGLVYYSHTTNLDVPMLFWMLVAARATVQLFESSALRPFLVFGAASGLALTTKEQSVGILLCLSMLLLIGQLRRGWQGRVDLRTVVRRLSFGGAAGLMTLVVMSNGLWNPAGLWNRIRFLSGTLPRDVHPDLVPRAPYVTSLLDVDLDTHARLLSELIPSLGWCIGPAWLALCLCGVLVGLRRPLTVLGVLAVLVTYYLLSLSVLPLIQIRYSIPLGIGLAPFGGLMCERLWRIGRPGRIVAAGAVALTLCGGLGVLFLMHHDPRYQAEEWLRENAPPGASVETYHKPTYLPRFPDHLDVRRLSPAEIAASTLEQRSPELILICVPDIHNVWESYRKYEEGVVVASGGRELVRGLLEGSLGYREVERFRAEWPLLPSGIIRSLAPTLILFARSERVESSLLPPHVLPERLAPRRGGRVSPRAARWGRGFHRDGSTESRPPRVAEAVFGKRFPIVAQRL